MGGPGRGGRPGSLAGVTDTAPSAGPGRSRRPADVAEVAAALAAEGYLADEGLATSIFLALTLRRPLLLEGEPGVGKTEVAKVLSRWLGGRAHPAPVLRGPRRLAGALRVGLLPPAAAPAGGRGGGHRRHRRRRPRGRALRRAVPRAPAAAAGHRPRRRAAAGAPGRRGRPGRRRVRGVPARGAGRLLDHRSRARHLPRRRASGRDHHLEPHPRRARRPQAALPLPLGRAPRPRAGDRHRAGPGARGRRAAGPPGRGAHRGAARARALQAAGRGRDHRLGPGAGRARAAARSTPTSVAATLGTVLKYREDAERVRRHGLDELVDAARARAG